MARRTRLATAALGLAVLTALAPPARADLVASVSSVVTPESGGMSLYSYTVSVAATSTISLAEFDLNLTSLPFNGISTPAGAPLSSITMPTGFINTYTLNDPTISFFSTGKSSDVAPGMSETFSFMSTSNPVLQDYLFTGYQNGNGNVFYASGTVLAPTFVPEPSSLALSGLGALAVLGRLALARRRKPAA